MSTFLSSFGIPGGELLRLEYVQVGFYFLLFYGSITAFTISLVHELSVRKPTLKLALSKKKKPGLPARKREIPPTHPLLIVIWLEFLLSIFITVGFAEPQVTGRASLVYVAILTALCFIVVPIMYQLDRHYGERNPDVGIVVTFVYVVLAISCGILGWQAIAPLKQKLVEMLWPTFRIEIVCIFLVFVGTLNWMIYRSLFPRDGLTVDRHRYYMASRLAIGIPIYYLCVLTFAYGIYPFMSVSKGGGYYKDAGYVRLTFRESNDHAQSPDARTHRNQRGGALTGSHLGLEIGTVAESNILPPDLMDQGGHTRALVLIEEDSDTISVANPAEPITPPSEGAGGVGVACWTDYLCRPRVFQVSVSDLSAIERIPPMRGQTR